MSNAISPQLTIGTIAELLVQARLLQFDVQAAPPLKDSGNDLIAIRGNAIRRIQIKATKSLRYGAPKKSNRYDILAAVQLHGYGHEIRFDHCGVFLIEKSQMSSVPRAFAALSPDLRLSEARIDALFPRRKNA